MDSNGDSLINVGESSIGIEDIIDLGNRSYLVPSGGPESQLQSTTSKDVNLDYPYP